MWIESWFGLTAPELPGNSLKCHRIQVRCTSKVEAMEAFITSEPRGLVIIKENTIIKEFKELKLQINPIDSWL